MKSVPFNCLRDGYYLVNPVEGSHWSPITVHIFDNGSTETYVDLRYGTCYSECINPTLAYYEEVASSGGSIKEITKDQFAAVYSLCSTK